MTSKRAPKKIQGQAGILPEVRPETKPTLAASLRGRFLLAALGLCALVAIAYGNSLGNSFVWDDHEQIVMNPYMKPDASMSKLFTADVRFTKQDDSAHTQVYRPLQLFTYRVVNDWFDGDAGAFHGCSLLLAMAGAIAAFAVFWQLTRRMGLAFAGAALFAVHPVHTEAIDWIAATPDLGFGLFVMLSLSFFLAARRGVRRGLLLGLSLAMFGVALLWKETAVVFPLLIAAYVFAMETEAEGRAKRAAIASAPYWGVLAVYMAVRTGVLGTLSTGPRDWALSPLQSLLTMLNLMLSYWVKLVLPLGLNSYHLFDPVRSGGDPRGWMALVLLAGAVAGVVVLARRAPLFAFAAVWVFLFLVPAMNFNGLGRNPFAERYLYLPSAGFCLLVVIVAAWVMERLPARMRMPVSGVLLVGLLAGYMVETVARNPDWKDDNTLFAKTLSQSPNAPFVRYMVATAQSNDSTTSATAEQNYRQTIELAKAQTPPDRLFILKGYEGLASLYADRAQLDQALEMLSQAKALAPNDPDVTGEEGMILARGGQGGNSEAALNKALAAQPNNENVLSALGLIARDEHHDLASATQYFKRALAAHAQEDDFAASQHNNLAAVYGDQDNFEAAIAEIRHAIRILPRDPEFHVNLASALAATGHFPEAKVEAQTALSIAPDDPNAREVLRRLNEIK